MKHYEHSGVCEVHGCALECLPQVYRPAVYFCRECEDGAAKKDAVADELRKLQATHIETLHELGVVKALLKNYQDAEKEQLNKAGA